METQSVVITGLGLISANAQNPDTLWQQIIRKTSSIKTATPLSSCGLGDFAAAYVDQNDLTAQLAMLDQDPALLSHSKPVLMALCAAHQALTQSDLPKSARQSMGLWVGCNKIAMAADDYQALSECLDVQGPHIDLDALSTHPLLNPDCYVDTRQDSPTCTLAQHFQIKGPISTHSDACAAGGIAIARAFQAIRKGEVEVALVGATEAMVDYFPLLGFTSVGALAYQSTYAPEQISRPFDKQRHGFVMGEGSAFLVLESASHAQKRGAKALSEILGAHVSAEAYKITATDPSGCEYATCMQGALHDAQISADEISHINAHGTSTLANDRCEAAGILSVFGTSNPPVTANKSAIGHSLAASGAIEAVLCVLSLQQQTLLPTLNFVEGDEITQQLNIVTDASPYVIETILSNSFGFGGENCSLIFKRS